MKFFCLGDEDTVAGFRMSGIAGQVVTSAEQTRAAVREIAGRPDCGIIIITEKLADGIRQELEMIRLEREQPLIVEIPGPEGPLPGRKTLRQFVQEAVGMRI